MKPRISRIQQGGKGTVGFGGVKQAVHRFSLASITERGTSTRAGYDKVMQKSMLDESYSSLDSQTPHHFRPMLLNRFKRNFQDVANLLTRMPFNNQLQDLLVTWCEVCFVF